MLNCIWPSTHSRSVANGDGCSRPRVTCATWESGWAPDCPSDISVCWLISFYQWQIVCSTAAVCCWHVLVSAQMLQLNCLQARCGLRATDWPPLSDRKSSVKNCSAFHWLEMQLHFCWECKCKNIYQSSGKVELSKFSLSRITQVVLCQWCPNIICEVY